jgi:hypothetical protein
MYGVIVSAYVVKGRYTGEVYYSRRVHNIALWAGVRTPIASSMDFGPGWYCTDEAEDIFWDLKAGAGAAYLAVGANMLLQFQRSVAGLPARKDDLSHWTRSRHAKGSGPGSMG